MLFLVAKGARHAATARGNYLNLVPRGEGKDFLRNAHQMKGFLVAVAVQLNFPGLGRKPLAVDVTPVHLLCEEFIDEQGVLGKLLAI